MAMSCYSEWDEMDPNFTSSMIIFPQVPQPELLQFDSDFAAFSDSYIDPYFYTLVPKMFPVQEYYDPYPYLKPQKLYEDSFNPEIMPSLCNGFVVPNPGTEILGPIFSCFASNISSTCGTKNVEVAKKAENIGRSLSAQSIAARQRRRKISEKTRELGKLVPGGLKMNTAEMFQAAFKYIKFLQAQLGILQTMASIHQESGESFENQEMECLLGSSLIEGKLCAAEKCLVPKKLVEYVANNHKFQPNTDHSFLDIKELLWDLEGL